MTHTVLLVVVGLVAGALGSVVGLGGGVFIVPALTLFLGIPIHVAVAASLVGVVATSTCSSAAYLGLGMVNIRLGMINETSLALGALCGGLAGSVLDPVVLNAVFGGVMVAVSLHMGLRRRASRAEPAESDGVGRVGSSYHDPRLGREVRYRVKRLPLGLLTGLVAGSVSGLLGVGGGFLTVPVLRLGMGVPMRAAIATSSLMLGVTACAGAVVYFARGMADPAVVVPVVLGVTVGALVGPRLALKARSSVLIGVLAVVLFALAVQMILAAAGISLR
jgi:hypothetical protein